MADRYWVGGTGSWSSTNTANWSASSGGASGASVPTAADNVIFDAGSDAGGNFIVTMANSPRLCNDFTASGLDFTMTLAGTSIGLTVSGSLSFPATNLTRTYTGTTTFNATTTGKTVTTNGVAFGADITFNGVGGAWTLGSALTVTSATITLTNGTFDTSASSYAVSAGQFSSSNSNVRTINLNGSTITATFIQATWTLTTSTNATLNAGTSTIVLTSNSAEFQGGGKTYYNLNFSSTSLPSNPFQLRTVRGVNTFNNLTCATTATDVNPFIIANNQTINGTLTINGANGNQRLFVRSESNAGPAGVQTLTCASVAATDVDFRDITIAGAAAPLSGTRLGDCTGNSGITFGAGVNKYWNLVGGGNWSDNAWATSSGGAVADTNFPLAQDTVIIENTGLNTSATVTVNVGYNIGSLDMSTRSNAMTFTISGAPIIYGNVAYSSAVTPSGTGTITFSNRSIKTFDSAGKTLDSSITVLAPSGGIQLINNNFATGSSRSTQISIGTIDLNDLNWTTGIFDLGFFGTRTLDFGTGVINLSGTGTVWNLPFAPGPTISGTPVVNVTSTGSTAITVSPGAVTEASSVSFNFTGGTYNLTFLSTTSHVARSVNFTGYAGTWQTTQANVVVYGNLTLSSGMSLTATTNTLIFGATSGTQTITSNAKTMDFPITISGNSAKTVSCADALTLGSTRALTFSLGTLKLAAGTTSTVGSFVTSGTTLKYLQSTTPGTQATISDASGTNTATYLSIQDSAATGGATWTAISATNVNAGNNSGWTFPQTATGAFLMFF